MMTWKDLKDKLDTLTEDQLKQEIFIIGQITEEEFSLTDTAFKIGVENKPYIEIDH